MMRRHSRLHALDTQNLESETTDKLVNISRSGLRRSIFFDYLKFILYCLLLIIPAYAIIRSAIDHNWLMMVIDILLIPVGFVHGVLLLTGVLG
jgi:hypothetical protein